MIKITREDLDRLIEIAERVARRTGQRVVVAWDRIEIVGQEH